MSPKTTETPSSGEEVPVRPGNSCFDILSLSVIIPVDHPNRRSHTVFLCIRIFVLKHRIDLNYHINCVKCRHFIPSSFSFRQLINAQKNRDKNVENAFVSCKKSITNFFASVNAAFRWKKIYNTAYFYYNIGRIKENHEQNRQLAQMIQEGGYGKSTGQKRQDTKQKGYHTAEQNSDCAEQDGKGAGK